MKKILLLLTIFTITSCSTTKKVEINFTYLDNPEHTTEYYTAGKEKYLLDILNSQYFNDIGIELVVGHTTKVVDSLFYSFRGRSLSSINDIWITQSRKYKRDGAINLLIKNYEPPITGLGYNGVMLITEQNLLKGSTFLHEFGHACGLKHYDDVCNFMYYTYTDEGVQNEITPFQRLAILRAIKNL